MAVHRANERGRIGDADQPTLERWRERWTAAVTDGLITSYFDTLGDSDLIPSDDADRRLLLDVYTLVKALYEVRYELSNRPDWVAWPMSSIVDLIAPDRR